MIIPLVVAGCIFLTIAFFLRFPLPSTSGLENDVDNLKDLIDWGLKRQTTHAALTLSALVSLFSLLRLRANILLEIETRLAYLGFLVFLAYEYFKLIRSFQMVNMWEELLSDNFGNENVFRLDPFQRLFFSRSTIHIVIQALLMAIITFTLLRIYDYATILQV